MFKERFGHCNVEAGWEEDPALAGWVSAQRTRRNNGLLYPERIRLLDELGFVWDFQTLKGQETWMKWYRELGTYVREHGNPQVPRSHPNQRLFSWVWSQRIRRDRPYGKAPPLTPEQIALLDKLDFRWDPYEEQWTERFEQLNGFKEKHGHCEVAHVEGDQSELSSWVSLQRNKNASGKLQAERKAKLDSIGFKWVAKRNDLKWQEMYERLKAYQATHGNADVPSKWKDGPKLAAWVNQQRHQRKRGQLSDEEVCLLDSLGLTWKSRGTWEDRLAEVAAFKAKHGNCEIPITYPENPKLGWFVNVMRTQRNNGTLSAERIAKLDALGFAWSSREEVAEGINRAWKTRYDELVQYKSIHDDCDVPYNWHENPQLVCWVNTQRQKRKNGELHGVRQRLLDELGFHWRRTEDWSTRFEQLTAYKERFGDCRVPVKWQENPQLGVWVTNQRHRLKGGTLPTEKAQLLREIGFE